MSGKYCTLCGRGLTAKTRSRERASICFPCSGPKPPCGHNHRRLRDLKRCPVRKPAAA